MNFAKLVNLDPYRYQSCGFSKWMTLEEEKKKNFFKVKENDKKMYICSESVKTYISINLAQVCWTSLWQSFSLITQV